MFDNPLDVFSIDIVTVYHQARSMELDAAEFSGRYLMGRDVVGMPMRHRIEEIVTQRPWDTTCILDFNGVDDISSSVGEELGPILSTWFTEQSRPERGRYLAYANLSDDVRFGLDDEFTRRGRVAIAFSFDAAGRLERADVLGQLLSPPLEDVVHLCYERGAITSSDLSEENPASASKKLTELHDKYSGLFCRRKVYGITGSRSWQYVYFSLVKPGLVLRRRKQEHTSLGA